MRLNDEPRTICFKKLLSVSCFLVHEVELSHVLKDLQCFTSVSHSRSNPTETKRLLAVSADISACVNHSARRLAGEPPRGFRDNTRQPEDNPPHNTHSHSHTQLVLLVLPPLLLSLSWLCSRWPGSVLAA